MRWSSKNRQYNIESYLPLLIPNNSIPSGSPLTHKEYTPVSEAECMRQLAAGARQTNVSRAQSLSPTLLGRWQREALAQSMPSSAECKKIKRLRTVLKRVEQERDMLNQYLPSSAVAFGRLPASASGSQTGAHTIANPPSPDHLVNHKHTPVVRHAIRAMGHLKRRGQPFGFFSADASDRRHYVFH